MYLRALQSVQPCLLPPFLSNLSVSSCDLLVATATTTYPFAHGGERRGDLVHLLSVPSIEMAKRRGTLRRCRDRKISAYSKRYGQMWPFFQTTAKFIVGRGVEHFLHGLRPNSLSKSGKIFRTWETSRKTVWYVHRTNEGKLEPRECTVGHAEATEAGRIAYITVTTKTQLCIPDRSASDVLPIQVPVPVSIIFSQISVSLCARFLEDHKRKMALVAALLLQGRFVDVQEPTVPG